MSTTKKSKSSKSKHPKVTPSSPSKSKSKSNTNTNTKTDTEARFEGTDPNWDYTPPPSAVLIKEDADTLDKMDAGEFDWDRINEDEELELWVVRVPEAIKPKHLENLSLSLPSSSQKSTRIGTVKRKTTTFDVWSIADAGVEGDEPLINKRNNEKSKNGAADNAQAPVGGEELKGMACLLPRKSKKGKLYPAPKPFTRHIVIAAQPIQPSPSLATSSITSDSPSESESAQYKNPPRYSYPKEVLKHRYIPYGSTELLSPLHGGLGGVSESGEGAMDVDKQQEEEEEEEEAPPSAQPPVESPKKGGRKEKEAGKGKEKTKEKEKEKEKTKEKEKRKGKKRKGEGEAEEAVPAKKAKKSK
ncbi:hypothetical protein BJ165DRAFT_1506698 [Panaeolus papilionaceus]|nr:hypothetical protein BJ165DRAFT_1506698 [Panaeolus papilionaceus]